MKFADDVLRHLTTHNQYPCSCVESSLFTPPAIFLGGTQTWTDLIFDDLSIRATRWPDKKIGSYVHGGFARRTLRLARDMNYFIENNDNFIISGHSLGGACSILLASHLVNANKKIDSVYTFGSPPLSSKGFEKIYREQELWNKTYNYVIPDDPVVKNIPIYKFVGNRIELTFSTEKVWEHHDLESYNSALKLYAQCELKRSRI